jgi:hypothetical protein
MNAKASDLLGHTTSEKFPPFANAEVFGRFTNAIEQEAALDFEQPPAIRKSLLLPT